MQTEITKVKTSDCKPDPNNPNLMTPAQMASLKASISEYGDLQPIVIDQDNNILDGAHRHQIHSELKHETIDAIRIHIENDTDRRIIRQTMNKLRGKHDPELDAKEFLAILKANEEKKLFEMSNIRETDFYKTLQLTANQEQADIIPETPETPITQPGDIWVLGGWVQCPKCKKQIGTNDAFKNMR